MQESFKKRVAAFWSEFVEKESHIRTLMDEKASVDELVSQMDEILKIAFNNAYFEMGINKEGKHELILTPEGDRVKLIQIYYWLQNAPELLANKWNFYATKPGKGGVGDSLSMFDIELRAEDVKIYAELDNERKKIDIQIYAPKLMKLEENQRYAMLFIELDQFISEIYSMEYIGFIDFIEDNCEDKQPIPLEKFRAYIDYVINENDWPMPGNPSEEYSVYNMKPEQTGHYDLRKDIVVGYTSCMPILNEYYSGESTNFDSYEADGLIYGFIYYDNSNVPRENTIAFRTEIEEKITVRSIERGAAYCIGGATGYRYSYIDFVIFDYDEFIAIAKDVLLGYTFREAGFSYFKVGRDVISFK